MPLTGRPEISVIVRARDEATNLGRCLELVRGQQLDRRTLEVILVDGGSRDATVEIARRHGARVVGVPASAFSFGGALNLGAANARGQLLVALSAHAFPLDPGWLARLCASFSDARVACACGDAYGPDGQPLLRRVEQDAGLACRRPAWGYSNAAGAFRAELWRARPFRSDLPACEDKDWAWHWLERGYVCVVDPACVVDHDHTHDTLRSIYQRARRESAGLAAFRGLPRYGPRQLAGEWWSDLRWYRSSTRARVSPRRAARLLGSYVGRRGSAPGRPMIGPGSSG